MYFRLQTLPECFDNDRGGLFRVVEKKKPFQLFLPGKSAGFKQGFVTVIEPEPSADEHSERIMKAVEFFLVSVQEFLFIYFAYCVDHQLYGFIDRLRPY